MMRRPLILVAVLVPVVISCGSSSESKQNGGAGGGGMGLGGIGGGGGGSAGNVGAGGFTPVPVPTDLCVGLVTDKNDRPMTTLAKPAVGQTFIDAEFGTTIRRITAVQTGGGDDPVIKPMYSTIPAWNADESLMILYHVGSGHELYHGRTYAKIRDLDISPADAEQVYWHVSDPDVFFYVDGKQFIRYHVGASRKEVLTTFSFCSGDVSGGDDPMFMSFDSNRIGLGCGDQEFIYDIPSNSVIGRKTMTGLPPQMAASGNLGWLGDTGRVVDTSLNVLRMLDLAGPDSHASVGREPNGTDTWNGHVYDDGPMGNTDIGSIVTWDLAKGTSKVVVGPKTGWPYPPGGHVSAVAIKQPGWTFLSVQGGDYTGAKLMDMELILANTVTGAVCRAGRHRSFGKDNTHLSDSYWAEAHNVPSPSGTRIAFGSDWMNGTTVDTYIVELPSYKP